MSLVPSTQRPYCKMTARTNHQNTHLITNPEKKMKPDLNRSQKTTSQTVINQTTRTRLSRSPAIRARRAKTPLLSIERAVGSAPETGLPE